MAHRVYAHPDHPYTHAWQDWINIVLAIWLFVSPWILQFGNSAPTLTPATTHMAYNMVSTAAWNAWISSAVVAIFAIWALSRDDVWQEWVNMALGAWIFLAPWILGFAAGRFPAAAWDHWIVGAVIFFVAASTAFGSRQDHA